MVDYRIAPSLGARIAAARKARGIRSTKALADLVSNATVTESILQNIETGRLANVSVTQLLNIAYALKVAPSFLLAPMGRPSEPIDLPNLADGLSDMSASEFDGWLSGSSDGRYRPSSSAELNERVELAALRDLENLLRERTRLLNIGRIDADASLQSGRTEPWKSTSDRIALVDEQIRQAHVYLTSAGWMLTGIHVEET